MSNRIALVTGGNKGIGYAIVKSLASANNHLLVLLGSRDAERGAAAAKQLAQSGLNVKPVQLDITSQSSITSAAKHIRDEYGGLDILVNNAGIAFKGDRFDEDVARTTIDTNYYGTKAVTKAVTPLLRSGARIVNVSSMASRSSLSKMSAERRAQFDDEKLTESALDGLMEEFISDVGSGTWKERGWPESAYGMSKVGVTMYTRLLAREQKTPGVAVNCCCPGYVRTDMTGAHAFKSPEQGALTPVKLALMDSAEATNGKFWEDERVTDVL